MYSDPMWATANRQTHLYETKYFHCKCPRCTDPSELGTEFSSLKCPTCTIDRHGYLTPIDPLGTVLNKLSVIIIIDQMIFN